MTLPRRYYGDFNPMDFIAELYQSATLDEAFAAYERQTQQLGFDGVLYTFVPQIYFEAQLPITPLYKTSAAYCPAFLHHYQEAEFEKVDFAVKKIALEGETQVIDWWAEERKGGLTQPERNVIAIARKDYGILNGMTIPLTQGIPGNGGVSCISSERDRLYGILVHERLYALQVCTRLFHTHVMATPNLKIYFLAALLDQLTPKEKRLLKFIVSGLPMKLLPDYAADISQKYGEKLVDNIRAKFGGVNRIRLIYYAGVLHFHNHL
ncbi:autoinducer binding domain-containing protein [Candidatus Thiothrix sp. Deng01]|uniref:Autoinducer binding domain-containing protein n=1 Tax=Candidatus Thiothrix phosphatis TaxID=3112415 RepID=A0ABU6CVH6_9GAMM|nr:autoinducer binding domain-containing protein [Candidatus Thiothrix sp. Deng01]MEB4590832.1 autoinducer binding domain-containing protein [Candidatus Thiothrix sp. Deng01]